MDPVLDAPESAPPPAFAWPTRPKFQDRGWLHVLLFMLTLAMTTLAGAEHYLGFLEFNGRTDLSSIPFAALYLRGFWYSATILAILGCHELGHYLACRYYDVDASLPFFLPMPILFTGTLGAFIRIREPIPRKRMLFDIGIAGPIAGFLIAIPALCLGLAMSTVVKIPANVPGGMLYDLGEPLAFKAIAWALWGTQPAGYTINMHPVAFAAWFGLLATALNLFPIGQLDGGHIMYAVAGRRATYVTVLMVGVALALTWFSTSWLLWTVITIAMLWVFGFRHPHVFDEHVPLDRGRLALALFALVMFVLCFTPAPIRLVDVVSTGNVSQTSGH